MLAFLPLLLTTLALADEPAPADHVVLTFGWRPGMKAVVTASESRDTGGGMVPGPEITATLDVRDRGDGELELRWTRAKQSKGAIDPNIADMLSAFRGTFPSEHVDATGAWRGLVDPDQVRTTLAKASGLVGARMATAIPDDPRAQAALALHRAAMERLLSFEVVSARTEQTWNQEIGFWLDGDLELGAVYEFDAEPPTAQGGTVKSHVTFQAVERAPCTAAKRAPACVRLKQTTVSDPDAFRAVALQTMQPALEAMGLTADALTDTRQESTVTLLVEPSTLRPWSAITEERTTFTVDANEPSGPKTTTRGSTRTKSWAWR